MVEFVWVYRAEGFRGRVVRGRVGRVEVGRVEVGRVEVDRVKAGRAGVLPADGVRGFVAGVVVVPVVVGCGGLRAARVLARS